MSHVFTSLTLGLLGLSGALLTARPAAAQTPVFGFTSGVTGLEDTAANTLADPNGSYSLGFEFTTTTASLVSSLGYFQDPAAPLTQNHDVGLYQLLPGGVNQLLASATVTPAGTAVGDFLYTALTAPVTLTAGGDYVLAGVSGPTDPYFFSVQDPNMPGNVGLTTAPGFSYVQDRYDVSGTLVLPTQTDPVSEPGFFGPNLLSSPVPEASTTVSFGLLLALGLGAAVGVKKRKA
jgi:hypothetical protein